MKQKLMSSGIYSMLLLFLMFSSYGCTLIGYGIGTAIDNSIPPKKYEYNKIGELKSGDRIRIIQRDSTLVEGRYKGFAPLDSSVYSSRYAEFLNQSQINMPGLGDTLRVRREEQLQECIFLGLRTSEINVKTLPTHVRAALPYGYLKILERQDGTTFDHNVLQGLAADGLLPLDESIVVESMGEEFKIPLNDIEILLNDIEQVERYRAKYAKWIGMGLGFGCDITAIIVIIALNNPLSGGYGGGGFQGPW